MTVTALAGVVVGVLTLLAGKAPHLLGAAMFLLAGLSQLVVRRATILRG